MKEQSTEEPRESSVTWTTLETFAREQIRSWLQRLLDAEVEELVGRPRYGRRADVDAPARYRNGYGKPPAAALRGLSLPSPPTASVPRFRPAA